MITIERIYSPSIDTSNAVNAASDKDVKRDDMAGFYADCILADCASKGRGSSERCDYKAINEAVIARWPRGLTYIKTRAWRIVEDMARAAREARKAAGEAQ